VSLGEFFRMVARWKWVIIPGVLMSVLAGAALFVLSPPTYTRTASYLLLAPVQTQQGPINPFLHLDNGIQLAAQVLTAKVGDQETGQALTADAPGLEYTVALNPELSAPLIEVHVTDVDAGAVDRTLQALGDELVLELRLLQQDSQSPPDTWITIQRLTQDPAPTVSYAPSLRKGVGVSLASAALAIGLVALLERRYRRRTVHEQGSEWRGTDQPTQRPADGTTADQSPSPVAP